MTPKKYFKTVFMKHTSNIRCCDIEISGIKQETAQEPATAFSCRNIYKYNARPETGDFLHAREF